MVLHLKNPEINGAPEWKPAPTRTSRPRLVPDTVEDVETSPAGPVKVKRKVRRRARSQTLVKVSAARVKAADEYAAAYEAVQAGGGGGAPPTAEKVDGGKGAAEGRQSAALDLVDRLARMDAAIGPDHVRLDARGAVVSHRMIVRAIAVANSSIAALLDALDVRRTARRERAIFAALDASLGRIAEEIGLEMREGNGKNR